MKLFQIPATLLASTPVYAAKVPRGVAVIDILNPEPSERVMIIHPDGRVEGGLPSRVMTPTQEMMFCASKRRRPRPSPHKRVAAIEGRAAREQIAPADRQVLVSLFTFLKTMRVKFADHTTQKIRVLVAQDPVSFGDFIKALKASQVSGSDSWTSADWTRISRALHRTAHFIDRWKEAVGWEGSLYDFYERNADNAKVRTWFHNKISQGHVQKVSFKGDKVLFEARQRELSPALKRETAFHAWSHSFLPSPVNRWGADDFALSQAEIQERIGDFFERLESRLGKVAAEVRRDFALNYPKIRQGLSVMTVDQLSDVRLDRLRLRKRERAELRHLEALLAIVRDLPKESEWGPYIESGRLLRYFRLYNQKSIKDLEPLYQAEYSLVRANAVETGRAAILDQEGLLQIAIALGVPRRYQQAFANHLMHSYRELQGSIVLPSDATATTFPNARWSIPYEALSEEEMKVRLHDFGTTLFNGLSAVEFERAARIKPEDLYALLWNGQLSPEVQGRLMDYLRKEGRTTEAHQLRVIRAALKMKRQPIPDWGAYWQAGRLLRLARFLMPGTPVNAMVTQLGEGVTVALYREWEWGFRRMPSNVLRRYGDHLFAQGALRRKQVKGLVKHVKAIYERGKPPV